MTSVGTWRWIGIVLYAGAVLTSCEHGVPTGNTLPAVISHTTIAPSPAPSVLSPAHQAAVRPLPSASYERLVIRSTAGDGKHVATRPVLSSARTPTAVHPRTAAMSEQGPRPFNPYHVKYVLTAADRSPVAVEVSPTGQQSMRRILALARADSLGKQPDGLCYTHVGTYFEQVGFGGIAAYGFQAAIPAGYRAEARQFAEYLNLGDHAARLGLQRLDVQNPYVAPAGAIVVVRAGTPGTHHPTAGDIAVAGGDGHFYNGGEMSYGGPANFQPGNTYVLGIFVPR